MARYVSTEEKTFRPGISYNRDTFGTGNYKLFYSSCAWQVPVGTTKVRATLLGAGGGPGGSYTSTQCTGASGVGFSFECTVAFQAGGAGAGGAFVVGTAGVTPNCTCCVIVGAGGGGGTAACCFSTPTTTAGSAGGFTCAFGLCAPGGGGGPGACCVCCSGCSTCCNVGCWNLTPCNTSAPAGGVASGGNILNVSGQAGSGTCGTCSCVAASNGMSGTRNFAQIKGGAPGSPLGSGSAESMANPLNCLAFDGTTTALDVLSVQYDLPQIKFPGQVIYTQRCVGSAPHDFGMICGFRSFSSSSCNFSCSGCNRNSCSINATRQSWQGVAMSDNCSACFATVGYNSCCDCSCSSDINPGCGGGGIPFSFGYAWWSDCRRAISNGAKAGGSGYAVVEW